MSNPRCFLDVDIDDWRASCKHVRSVFGCGACASMQRSSSQLCVLPHSLVTDKRAQDFVKATNLRYSLSSNVLEELGGSEKNRIRKELYPNDFEWPASVG